MQLATHFCPLRFWVFLNFYLVMEHLLSLVVIVIVIIAILASRVKKQLINPALNVVTEMKETHVSVQNVETH